MRHQKKGRKLGREKGQKKALLRAMMQSLVQHEKIKTTEAKAKELRPYAETLITRARKGDLASRRHIAKYLTKSNAKKLFDEIGPRYKERPGGYTRIYKLPPRKTDGSKMSVIEFV